jgi:hypothetical protein
MSHFHTTTPTTKKLTMKYIASVFLFLVAVAPAAISFEHDEAFGGSIADQDTDSDLYTDEESDVGVGFIDFGRKLRGEVRRLYGVFDGGKGGGGMMGGKGGGGMMGGKGGGGMMGGKGGGGGKGYSKGYGDYGKGGGGEGKGYSKGGKGAYRA